MEGASYLGIGTGEFYEGKLAGKNCMEAIFTRFPGFRLRSIAYGNGNGLQATLPPFQSGVGFISSKAAQKKTSWKKLFIVGKRSGIYYRCISLLILTVYDSVFGSQTFCRFSPFVLFVW